MNLEQILTTITEDATLHAKWLNTLSMMENTGARKISACEHPTLVTEVMLKHAAEEARHAYYLKKQIAKIKVGICPTYEFSFLLAPMHSYQYLHKLDVVASRYIQENFSFSGYDLRFASYLLVTYAIEVRADKLYPVYQDVLDRINSKVNVKSIIAEEEGHLEEMQRQLETSLPDWQTHTVAITNMEEQFFSGWITDLHTDINATALLPHSVAS